MPADVTAIAPASPMVDPLNPDMTFMLGAIARLPGPQAALLRDMAQHLAGGGVSLEELARRHKLPLTTVRSRLARGQATLRARLGLPPTGPLPELLREVG